MTAPVPLAGGELVSNGPEPHRCGLPGGDDLIDGRPAREVLLAGAVWRCPQGHYWRLPPAFFYGTVSYGTALPWEHIRPPRRVWWSRKD